MFRESRDKSRQFEYFRRVKCREKKFDVHINTKNKAPNDFGTDSA